MAISSLVVSLLSIASTPKLIAQSVPFPCNMGSWIGYVGDQKMNQKIGVHAELQLRNLTTVKYQSNILSRIGINWYVDPSLMLTAGYGYIGNATTNEELTKKHNWEHRAWQQMLLRQKTNAFRFTHRYRMEQRWLHNHFDDKNVLQHRLRYRFQAILPLYYVSPKMKRYFVNAHNEVFVKWSADPRQIFDRNRLVLGLGYQANTKMNVQLMYINQVANNVAVNQLSTQHLAMIGFSYNIDNVLGSLPNQ
jgi:hypothetical protein